MDLKFEPVQQYFQKGNQIQICRTTYKDIGITWRTIFYWNIFREPSDWVIVDRIVSDGTIVPNGRVELALYTEEGFGYPCFNNVADAISWIDNNVKKQ